MKHYLLALPLLALGAPALANTGVINFTGSITAGTCPIEIRDPAGGTGGEVKMGEALAGNFDRAGIESNHRSFTIEVADASQCAGWNSSSGAANVAKVRFSGMQGGADSGNLFALKTGGGAATGLALGLQDKDKTQIGHGAISGEYPLNSGGTQSDLTFTAFYKSTAATVTAGTANADVQLELVIN
ncbi:fimbrial protein [Pseudomonas sp. RIT-PI-S]|uniref:fimbrial protein n=1 Tax=Pseudomonas sp. RIT-PI-S TaxID=3035295 RepID=UPI0021DAA0C7|nr:fimbrial protein [Pseudomonas sp. RIT-PI-S]